MTITKELNGNTLTIFVEGWLDTLTAPQFRQEVQDLQGAEKVILDFEGVDYISSAGLRETVALYREAVKDGGSFELRHVNGKVMDVFTLTGFDKKLNISAD